MPYYSIKYDKMQKLIYRNGNCVWIVRAKAGTNLRRAPRVERRLPHALELIVHAGRCETGSIYFESLFAVRNVHTTGYFKYRTTSFTDASQIQVSLE